VEGAAVYVARKSAAIFVFLVAVAAAAAWPTPAPAVAEQALVLTASPAVLTCGSTAALAVRDAAPGAALTLSRKRAGDADFVTAAEVTARKDGTFSWTVKPSKTTVFRVEQAAGDMWQAGAAEVTIGVRTRVKLVVSAPAPLVEHRRIRYTVTVRPLHPGGTVQLARRSGSRWEVFGEVKLGSRSSGTARLDVGAPGRLVVRAQTVADAEHLAGQSQTWKRTVYDKSNRWGVPARYPHLILVSVHHYRLFYYEHGVMIRSFDCVTGRPSLPTPLGHFRIYAKDPHIGGPYGPYRMRYLGLFAIHGTNEPWLLSRYPRNFSHGCTRLSNANITWLYPRIPVGTPVWNVP
jgi:hypothetical protein